MATPIGRSSTSKPENPGLPKTLTPLKSPSSNYDTTSPYYHGLTDSNLYVRSLSPGRDRFASSSSSTKSSSSSSKIGSRQSCSSKIGKKRYDEDEEEEGGDFMPKVQLPRGDSKMPLRESDAAAVAAAARKVTREEREYVWAYNYRPRFLKEFICHRDQVAALQEMVRMKQCSHFIFEGPTGVGKTTMVLAFLRDASGVEKLKTIKELRKIELKIVEVLEFIAKKEHVELPHHLAEQIVNFSKNNLRQAIRSFEASWKSKYSLKDEQDILTGWEEVISNIAKSIVKEQSPKQIYIIRGKLKNLIEHYVSPGFIFNYLILELKRLLDDWFKIDAMYQEYKVFDSGPMLNPEKSVVSFLGRRGFWCQV